MIRSALTLLSAHALSAAVAVELVHNFSLLHDDIMDGDRLRRHHPTAWTVFGIPAALLAGDALLALALQVVSDDHRPGDALGIQILAAALGRLMDGQNATPISPIATG
ncbi:polyprenyl synthetase family protein [Amycolatopsis alba]|uniref:polyprenyl synthetase family protein n=1 Tax=Amycolatopsis alba TaxID=76020 RepID=UPI002468AF6A|nr:polyprenyl synthetase family protein [Amycolatopsis alba]